MVPKRKWNCMFLLLNWMPVKWKAFVLQKICMFVGGWFLLPSFISSVGELWKSTSYLTLCCCADKLASNMLLRNEENISCQETFLLSFPSWRRNCPVQGWFVFIHCIFFLSLSLFRLCVTRIQQSATSCHLFHLATSHKSLCCIVLHLFLWDCLLLHPSILGLTSQLWLISHVVCSFKKSWFFTRFSFLFFFFTSTPWLPVKPAAALHRNLRFTLLGLDSLSQKAHRPCRPYGAT